MRTLFAVLLGLSWVGWAQMLPEGDTGIAAQYPDDVGLAQDSRVVFFDDFEGISGNQLTPANSQWDNVYGGVRVTRAAADVHAGSAAVEISLPNAQAYGAWRDFGTNGFDTLFVRYYLKYHPSYPGVHHQGVTVFAGAPGVTTGSSTGVKPNGTNHFTVGLDNLNPNFSWSPPGNTAPPGWLEFYCYHLDQGGDYGDVFLPSGDYFMGQPALFGPTFVARPRINPPRGVWLSFEIMVKANTPGQRDGRIAFWVDGVLAADFPNLRFRTTAALKPNFIVLAPYSSEVLPNQVLWYDDVVAATSYIGPMKRGGAVDAGTGGGGGAATGGGGGSSATGGGSAATGGGGGGGGGGSAATGGGGGSAATGGGGGGSAATGGGASATGGGGDVAAGGCSSAPEVMAWLTLTLSLARRRRAPSPRAH